MASIISPALGEFARAIAGIARPVGVMVMLSGRGRTLANLIEAQRGGVWGRGDGSAAEIRLVVASSECVGAEVGRREGIPTRVVPGVIPAAELVALAEGHGCSLVVLAGYLRRVEIAPALLGRVLNIHPALLRHGDDATMREALRARGVRDDDGEFGGAGMYGERVHRAVLDAGVATTGCTVHLCDGTFDTGAILLRRTCAVIAGDTSQTLAARVFEEERRAYPEALARSLGVWNPNGSAASMV